MYNRPMTITCSRQWSTDVRFAIWSNLRERRDADTPRFLQLYVWPLRVTVLLR